MASRDMPDALKYRPPPLFIVTTMLPSTPEEKQAIIDYMNSQAPDLTVEFLQKVYVENVLGHQHAVWELGLPGGRERCSLLMADTDPLYLAAANRVGERIERIADEAEDMLDPDLFEHADQDVCYRLGHLRLLRCCDGSDSPGAAPYASHPSNIPHRNPNGGRPNDRWNRSRRAYC
jgi:hypothetical protein